LSDIASEHGHAQNDESSGGTDWVGDGEISGVFMTFPESFLAERVNNCENVCEFIDDG
jgi:hypothetical protein